MGNQSDDSEDIVYSWKRGCAVFTDAVGYSTRIEQFPLETRRDLTSHFQTYENLIVSHGGRVIDRAGDGLFAEFSGPDVAIKCALAFQSEVSRFNDPLPIDHRMRFRVGIAYGDILQEKELISGPKVNIAARLQQLAEPGTVVVDGDAHKMVEDLEDSQYTFASMGFRVLKGMSNPARVWRVVERGEAALDASDVLAAAYGEDGEENIDARGIAVLPFDVPPGNEENEYLAEGLVSDIADGLARSHWLRVISARSSMNYAGGDHEDADVANELGVRYLLRGRIRWMGPDVRITASLSDSASGEIVWSENFNRKNQNIFDLQDEITSSIVAKIEPEFLRHEAQRAASGRPRNVDAWDLLMRSRWHFWRGSRKHVKLAITCAEKALQLDPDSSETLAQLSFCHMTEVWTAQSDDPVFQIGEALRFARQAVNSDDTNANAHFTLGTALSLNGEVKAAIMAERRALELNPNSAGALGELGRLLAFDGKPEEGRRAALKAIDLSPSDPHVSLWVRTLALAAFVEGDFDSACELAREACAKRPDWFFTFALLASCEALGGHMESAQQALADVHRMIPAYPRNALRAGHPFTDRKHFDRLIEGLEKAGWTNDGPGR